MSRQEQIDKIEGPKKDHKEGEGAVPVECCPDKDKMYKETNPKPSKKPAKYFHRSFLLLLGIILAQMAERSTVRTHPDDKGDNKPSRMKDEAKDYE